MMECHRGKGSPERLHRQSGRSDCQSRNRHPSGRTRPGTPSGPRGETPAGQPASQCQRPVAWRRRPADWVGPPPGTVE